jgi:tripartite-type tricarboxylate transporter receptor subunit TctC
MAPRRVRSSALVRNGAGRDPVQQFQRIGMSLEEPPDDVRDRLTEALDAMAEDEAMIGRFETASLPFQYRDHQEVNDWMETQNQTYIRIIEENREQFEGN